MAKSSSLTQIMQQHGPSFHKTMIFFSKSNSFARIALAVIVFSFVLQAMVAVPAFAKEIDIPTKVLPLVKSLPDTSPLILEERFRDGGCADGEAKTKYGDCPHGTIGIKEFGIINFDTGVELAWDLPAIGMEKMSLQQKFECAGSYPSQSISWAAAARRLLRAACGVAILNSPDGSVEPIPIRMPGKLNPFAGMMQYSVSSDAKRISYSLYIRDKENRLYRDLMVQDAQGSMPTSVSKESTTSYRSALNPDGSNVAYYSESSRSIKIANLRGEILQTIELPSGVDPGGSYSYVEKILWSPDGNQLAAIIKNKLYFLKLPETVFKSAISNENVGAIASMAWSPDGSEIAFRSAYEGEQTCAYGPQFSGGSITLRTCAKGYRLYSVDLRTGNLRRLNASTEYNPGQLFWIQ